MPLCLGERVSVCGTPAFDLCWVMLCRSAQAEWRAILDDLCNKRRRRWCVLVGVSLLKNTSLRYRTLHGGQHDR